MQGEQVASGALHVDNIAPSLYGGLVLTVGIDNPHVKQIPVPDDVRCVLVHPHIELPTRKSREVLKTRVALSDVVWQQANLAGFLTGCFTGDLQSDPRLARGRRHRAAAARADSGLPVASRRRRSRTARSAVRSPAPARRCSPGASTARATEIRDAMVAAFERTASRPTLDLADRLAGRAGRHAHEVRQHARRRRGRDSLSEALAQGLAPDGACTFRHAASAMSHSTASIGQRRPAGGRRDDAAPFADGDRSQPAARLTSARGVRLSRAAGPVSRGSRRSGERARAVSRADLRVQGFRRALPRRRAGAAARRLRRAS